MIAERKFDGPMSIGEYEKGDSYGLFGSSQHWQIAID